MIVEDDFLIAMEMEDALTQAGFEVILACSGEEALAIAGERNPALTIMDIRLPGALDGVDAALALFQNHRLRSIFSTAHSDPDTRARAAPAQPAGWLVKPYTMPSLVSAVRAALDAHNLPRS
ncbi:response regulator [Sinorhizobium sp. CB7]